MQNQEPKPMIAPSQSRLRSRIAVMKSLRRHSEHQVKMWKPPAGQCGRIVKQISMMLIYRAPFSCVIWGSNILSPEGGYDMAVTMSKNDGRTLANLGGEVTTTVARRVRSGMEGLQHPPIQTIAATSSIERKIIETSSSLIKTGSPHAG